MDIKQGLDFYRDDLNSERSLVVKPAYFSGGEMTIEQIDTIKNFPDATEISITSLKQETFNYFIDSYGQQFKVIRFWGCDLVSDFTKLEQLSDVEYLVFFGNKRVTHLWDLSKNEKLKGLCFDDFSRMHTLEEIPLAPALEELSFGSRVWNTYVLESLTPLCKTEKLKRLSFNAKKIEDNDITPLTKIPSLENLEFPANLFTTEMVAWLAANVKNVSSSVLVPYKILENPIRHNGKDLDVLIVGKRKPFLDSGKDRTRLEKYEAEFLKLVEKYKSECSNKN